MDAIEKRARELLEQAEAPARLSDYGYDQDDSIYFEDDVLELLIAALTPPEGFVLVEKAVFDSMREFVIAFPGMSRNNAENLAAEIVERLDAARPEVP